LKSEAFFIVKAHSILMLRQSAVGDTHARKSIRRGTELPEQFVHLACISF
jgi:hypothetical protein